MTKRSREREGHLYGGHGDRYRDRYRDERYRSSSRPRHTGFDGVSRSHYANRDGYRSNGGGGWGSKPPAAAQQPDGSDDGCYSPGASDGEDPNPFETLKPALCKYVAASSQSRQRQQPILCPLTARGLPKLEEYLGKRYQPMAKALGWPEHPSNAQRCMEGHAPCRSQPCKNWGALQQHADKRFGAKVDAHAFDATVPWPPLLHISGLPGELNSSNLLLQSFGKQGVKDAHPIYLGPFTGRAVLVFEKDHSGWERAKAFLDTCGMDRDEVVRLRGEGKTEEAAAKEKALIKSEWVQEHVYNGRWKNEQWAKKKLFRTVVVFRRKNELEQEVAEAKRMQREEQARLLLRSVQEAEKERKLREEEAANAQLLKDQYAER
ncbi:hypothetical protein EMIHUDRAFT_194251 [Emiliania huxleyi CCMP1516]|uniref:XS domain-containing protein n=2 Tax=Emiliania huxleyi TaxID=2903 RepID=A0A0D3L169_EMIH1|nr:hypothetical protein EMIHUDRAFT_194251 [Emiliania huxleyi CCMP1516]EOD41754.1 hypothetical protein EMIHUDRAFT_194251 [Emiliania huxleyi CCMP1516]|eukprot:XP_005794183.1 hypothetical protein EMIHUDRAFT_194251 [Emiliania huxleyi CCMP1516]